MNDRSGRLPGQGSVAVRRMSPGEMVNACQVLGLAFADNPSTLANVHGDRDKARRTTERAVRVVKLGTRCSHVLVAEQDDRLAGVLNAVPWPHCQLRPWEKFKTAPTMIAVMGSALPPRAHHDERAGQARSPRSPLAHRAGRRAPRRCICSGSAGPSR